MSGRSSHSSHSSLQHTHPRFEHAIGRITHARIDIAVLRPCKFAGTVVCVCEVVGTGLIKWDSSGAIDRIRFLSTVKGNSIPSRLSKLRNVSKSMKRQSVHSSLLLNVFERS